MAAQLLIEDRPHVSHLRALDAVPQNWQGGRAWGRQVGEMSERRCDMSANRFMADLLSIFESQFYAKEVHLEIWQSASEVLHVERKAAESVARLLIARILTVTEPGAILQIQWVRRHGQLTFRMNHIPSQFPRPKGICIPLLPMHPVLSRQLENAGVRFEEDSHVG